MGGKLEGIVNRKKVVMKMENISFTYPGTDKRVLNSVSVKLALCSRVALLGKNGAGKTTMLKLLVNELMPNEGMGETWQHHNLRVSYIAQHSMHHLEGKMHETPVQYMQNRFAEGRDRELANMSTHALTDDEKEMLQKRHMIDAVVSRRERGKGHLWYEVHKCWRKEDDTDWEPLEFLKNKDPYVMKLVRNCDEKMKALQAGTAIRPTTVTETRSHLEDFGITGDLADRPVKGMSGGQKCRLVLAAALWTKPHLVALDEPTNYLDNDTLAALTRALLKFKGAVITISHNEAFVKELAKERYFVENGNVRLMDPKEGWSKPPE